MVNIYDVLRNEDGSYIPERTKLFISKIGEDGEIHSSQYGKDIIPEGTGFMFIVDEYVAKQVDKLVLIGNSLEVKEGELLEVPEKSEDDIREEELLRQLAELRASRK